MVGEASLVLRLLAWVLLCSVEVLGSYYPKAIPTEAGESICGLSRKLKDVVPWTQEKLAALRKVRDEYESKFLDWKLHFHGSSECGQNESLLDEIQTVLEKVNKEIKTLPKKATHAGALAAKSAGRLDEFITVFANARGSRTSKYCLGSKGDLAKRSDIYECFPTGEKTEMGEANLAKIPESATAKSEMNLTVIIKNVNHSAVAENLYRYGFDGDANCNLINGKTGILSGTLKEKLWWGGGILTIGKDFDGEIKHSQFVPGEITNAKVDENSSKAFWTEKPSEKIPHLQKTLAAFQAFKEAAAKITQKITEIEKIEKQIEPCLSNETMEDRPTQSCFKNAVKLNAELQAANALLARYHKEKGPLPSEGSSILHQSVVNVLYIMLFYYNDHSD